MKDSLAILSLVAFFQGHGCLDQYLPDKVFTNTSNFLPVLYNNCDKVALMNFNRHNIEEHCGSCHLKMLEERKALEIYIKSGRDSLKRRENAKFKIRRMRERGEDERDGWKKERERGKEGEKERENESEHSRTTAEAERTNQ